MPPLLQCEGTAANVGSMTCTGTLLATSPAILISADCTGPQVYPLTKGAHSPTGLPPAAFCRGSESGKAPPPAEDKRRRPYDPVSTRIPLIVWQLELEGTHTVTLVKTPLA